MRERVVAVVIHYFYIWCIVHHSARASMSELQFLTVKSVSLCHSWMWKGAVLVGMATESRHCSSTVQPPTPIKTHPHQCNIIRCVACTPCISEIWTLYTPSVWLILIYLKLNNSLAINSRRQIRHYWAASCMSGLCIGMRRLSPTKHSRLLAPNHYRYYAWRSRMSDLKHISGKSVIVTN